MLAPAPTPRSGRGPTSRPREFRRPARSTGRCGTRARRADGAPLGHRWPRGLPPRRSRGRRACWHRRTSRGARWPRSASRDPPRARRSSMRWRWRAGRRMPSSVAPRGLVRAGDVAHRAPRRRLDGGCVDEVLDRSAPVALAHGRASLTTSRSRGGETRGAPPRCASDALPEHGPQAPTTRDRSARPGRARAQEAGQRTQRLQARIPSLAASRSSGAGDPVRSHGPPPSERHRP